MKWLAVLLVLLMCGAAPTVGASDYYVGPSGSDSTGNGTIGNPYATIEHVVDLSSVGDGVDESGRDYVYLLDGDYSVNQSGVEMFSTKKYITVSAVNVGSVNMNSSGTFIRICSAHNITIKGLYATASSLNSGSFAYIYGESRDILVEYNNFSGGTRGVMIGANLDNTSHGVARITVDNCNFSNNGASADGGHHGILVTNTEIGSWADRIVLSNNICNDNGEDGIQTAGHLDNSHADESHIAAYVEIYNNDLSRNGENAIDIKASRYIRFYNNTCLDNSKYAVIFHEPENSCDGTASFECAIYNNWFEGSGVRQIGISSGDVLTGYTKNIIFNNVIINGLEPGTWFHSGCNIDGDKVFHNTYYGHVYRAACNCGTPYTCLPCAGFGITSENSGVKIQNCLIFGNQQPGFHVNCYATKENNFHDGSAKTNNTVITDPKFVDSGNKDFHLQSDSPAIDNSSGTIIFTSAEVTSYKNLMGSDLPIDVYGPTVDKDGNARSNRTSFDIGAYEYISETPDPISLSHSNGTTWVNHTWAAGSGNITDSYNVSINLTWYNSTTNVYYNHTGLLAGLWSNITVYAWNSTYAEISSGSVSENVQLPTDEFSPSHSTPYYNVSSQIINTVNSTNYYVWNRTITSDDSPCYLTLQVTT